MCQFYVPLLIVKQSVTSKKSYKAKDKILQYTCLPDAIVSNDEGKITFILIENSSPFYQAMDNGRDHRVAITVYNVKDTFHSLISCTGTDETSASLTRRSSVTLTLINYSNRTYIYPNRTHMRPD